MRFSLSFLVVLSLIFSLLCSNTFAGGIGWEAEDSSAINPPMQVYVDLPEASGGMYIASPTADQGSVEYEIEVPKSGRYFLWVRFRSQDTRSNSWYLQVDDSASAVGDTDLVWDTIVPDLMPKELGEEVGPLEEPGPAWEFGDQWWWLRLLDRIDGQFNVLKIRVLDLSVGKHKLYLWNREANTRADAFYLSDRFDEQPVLPEEAPGLLAVKPEEKLAVTWGEIKR
jgi:hypothetical protein